MAEERERCSIEFKDIPAERRGIPEISVEERSGNFNEVELGFTEELAIGEAKRCLSCRRCLGCALCLAECHAEAVDFQQADQDIEIEVDSIILTPGARRFPSALPDEFGYGKYPNVITGIEFERILSDNGPYGGLVIQPYDGEVPKRIAFVHCIEGQDAHSFAYAAKEMLIAQGKIEGLQAHMFFSNPGITQREVEKYFGKGSGVTLRHGKVQGINEIESSRNLSVQSAEKGKTKEYEFDLVVLFTGFESLPAYKESSQKLGIKLGCYWETSDVSLAETSSTGVFLAGYLMTE